MAEIKLNVGVLAATCALCAVEVGVNSPVYENLLAVTVCSVCSGFGLYIRYKNLKTAIAKTKGPIKGRVQQVRKSLQKNIN